MRLQRYEDFLKEKKKGKYFCKLTFYSITKEREYRSRPGLSWTASSKVRMVVQRVAARLVPPLRPPMMIDALYSLGRMLVLGGIIKLCSDGNKCE